MSATEHVIENTCYRIVDEQGYRILLVQGDDTAVMSVMRHAEPDVLVTPVSAVMFAFLVFKPRPGNVLLIGLGGGQQAKFLRSRMCDTRLVAVEIDPAMVRIARSYFHLPTDDDRLSVLVCDGSDYIKNQPSNCDVIMRDGYDPSYALPDSLTGDEFYRACHRALRSGGIMVVNLFRQEGPEREAHVRTISKIFPAGFVLPVDGSQSVLLVFKDAPRFDWQSIIARAEQLEPHFEIGLPSLARFMSLVQTGTLRRAGARE